MRLLLAACFVLAMCLGLAGWIASRYPDGLWPWWAGPSIIAVFFGSLVGSLILFNRRGFRSLTPGQINKDYIEELRRKSLLLSESFTARRAFQVQEFEDEGSHYFIELDDRRTLYLNGQYLYDFEPLPSDPEPSQSRKFPCTEFTILRHKSAGYVVDIVCAGKVLEPELVAPPFTEKDRPRETPEDGTVFTEMSYDQLKAKRLQTFEF